MELCVSVFNIIYKASNCFIDGRYTFEIGGEGKGNRQLEGLSEAYVAADDIEFGSGNKVPLWAFGFLYGVVFALKMLFDELSIQ